MTDDSKTEKAALKNVWPDTPQYLCHFHVGQAEWRWLVDGKNGIGQNDRQEMMMNFQQVTINTEIHK